MTLDDLASLLDRCAASGARLTELVAHAEAADIRLATNELAGLALQLQQSLPQVEALLAQCPDNVRGEWMALVQAAAHPFKVGAELSSLGASRAAAQLGFLAQATGMALHYGANGQLAR